MKKLVALLIVSLAFATAPAFAGWDEAYKAYATGDYKTSLAEFRPFAEQGDAKAQYNMGQIYREEQFLDYKEAAKWYSLSAEQGYKESQYNLGLMYHKGQGAPQDYKTAVEWYRLAAEQGFASAQNNLGLMYAEGLGVSKDYVRAHMWYNIAASNGEELTLENRDNLAEKMIPSQIEKAQDLARECIAKDYKGC